MKTNCAKFLLLLFLATSSQAAEITITWENPKNSDIVGYFFESVFQSGLTRRDDIGLSNKYKVQVDDNKDYTFFIIPYDRNKIEGKKSNIIRYRLSPKVEPVKMPTPEIKIQK